MSRSNLDMHTSDFEVGKTLPAEIDEVSLHSKLSVSRRIFFSSGGVVPEPSRGVRGHAPPGEMFLYPLHWNA